MNSPFKVITDVKEITKYNRKLFKRLSETFSEKHSRRFGSPAGNQVERIRFEAGGAGANVRAWLPESRDGRHFNFLFFGDPGTSTPMPIALELNFPASEYNRKIAGAFVIDNQTGDILIAHRGKLTKGRASLPTSKIFREFAAQTVEAEDNDNISKVILISTLDDDALVDRLWKFAVEVRGVATRIAVEQGMDADSEPASRDLGSTSDGRESAALSKKDLLLKLRNYFDEYSGEGNTKGHRGGKRVVEHGDIVKALEARLISEKSRSQKAQAIDLAIVTPNKVDIYEVKTSTRTTDIYMGVGQLIIHGECIHELVKKPVQRHLVLPSTSSYDKQITKGGRINIVTYKKYRGNYKFSGLIFDSTD